MRQRNLSPARIPWTTLIRRLVVLPSVSHIAEAAGNDTQNNTVSTEPRKWPIHSVQSWRERGIPRMERNEDDEDDEDNKDDEDDWDDECDKFDKYDGYDGCDEADMDDVTDTDSNVSDRTIVYNGSPDQRIFVRPRDEPLSSDEENLVPSIERDEDYDEDIEEDQTDDDDPEGRMVELPPPPKIKVVDVDQLLMPPPPKIKREDVDASLMPPPVKVKVEDMHELLLPPGPDEAVVAGLQPPREVNEENMAELPLFAEHKDEDMPDLPPPPKAYEELAPDSDSSPLSSLSPISTPPWMRDAL